MVKITEISTEHAEMTLLENAEKENVKLEKEKERKAKQEVSQKNKFVKTYCQRKIGQDKVVVFTTSNNEACSKIKLDLADENIRFTEVDLLQEPIADHVEQIVERLHQYVLDKDIILIQADEAPLSESCYDVPYVFVNETYYGGIEEIPAGIQSGEFHEKLSEEPKIITDWSDHIKKPKKSRGVEKDRKNSDRTDKGKKSKKPKKTHAKIPKRFMPDNFDKDKIINNFKNCQMSLESPDSGLSDCSVRHRRKSKKDEKAHKKDKRTKK